MEAGDADANPPTHAIVKEVTPCSSRPCVFVSHRGGERSSHFAPRRPATPGERDPTMDEPTTEVRLVPEPHAARDATVTFLHGGLTEMEYRELAPKVGIDPRVADHLVYQRYWYERKEKEGR